jgi:hypothetical protein
VTGLLPLCPASRHDDEKGPFLAARTILYYPDGGNQTQTIIGFVYTVKRPESAVMETYWHNSGADAFSIAINSGMMDCHWGCTGTVKAGSESGLLD